MTVLSRLLCFARSRFAGPGRAPAPTAPELWCRAATVLALRNRAAAPAANGPG